MLVFLLCDLDIEDSFNKNLKIVHKKLGCCVCAYLCFSTFISVLFVYFFLHAVFMKPFFLGGGGLF